MTLIHADKIIDIVTRSMNYIDSRLVDHGKRVALIMAEMLWDQPAAMVSRLCAAALIHDMGAYRTEELNRITQFETEEVWEHSVYGYLFMREFTPFRDLAKVVLYHHAERSRLEREDKQIRFYAQVMCVADRADCFFTFENKADEILMQRLDCPEKFDPAVVARLKKANERCRLREYTRNVSVDAMIRRIRMTEEEAVDYLKMAVFTIDFRSRFTVNHTIAVAGIARRLAELKGLDADGAEEVYLGALLHDLGKISTPLEILESSGRLNDAEMRIMREHVVVSEKILDGCVSERIKRIAVRHHERLNGRGYPRGLTAEDLTIQERIVAVADVVSALYGARSYKAAFSKEKILKIIDGMHGELDSELLQIVTDKIEELMSLGDKESEPVLQAYENSSKEYRKLMAMMRGEEKFVFA